MAKEKKADRDAGVKKALDEMAKKGMSREERIKKMCETINKGAYGGDAKDAVTYLGSREVIPLERFTSGDPEIDKALGGGWPRGRFIEIYGPESGGKTTCCLHAIAEFQRKYPDEDVALIDTEYSFDEEYAKALGVNTRWLIVHQPDNGTQALNVLDQLIKLGVAAIIVDSVAALTTAAELEGNLGDVQVAEQARLMSSALRRLTTEAGKRKTTVFWTNQLREKIGVTYGDSTTTPAGRALKHYASIRCAIRRIGTEKEKVDGEEVAIANATQIDVKKNKTAPPFRVAKFFISYGRGIDPVVSTFDGAVKRGIIEKKGSWFIYGQDSLAQGRYKGIETIRENEELYAEIKQKLDEAIASKSPVVIKQEDEKKVIKKPKSRSPKKDDGDDAVEVTDV